MAEVTYYVAVPLVRWNASILWPLRCALRRYP
jgi:hypothetical protein